MKSLSIIIFIFLITSAIAPASAQEIDLESDLILYLPFNGDADDESGEGVPTNVLGPTLTTDRHGNDSSAYLFDGIDDRINLNNDNPIIQLSPFTICAWVKLNGKSLSETSGNTIFAQRDDISEIPDAKSTIVFEAEQFNNVCLKLRSSTPSDGSSHFFCSNNNKQDGWHHYATRIDNANMVSVFIDGVLLYSSSFPENGNFSTSVDHVNIGTHHYRNAVKGALNGIMDEIRIYSRALNDCEIETLYSEQIMKER